MNINDCIIIPLTKIIEFRDQNVDLSCIFQHPGILGIYCKTDDSAYLFETPDCWLSLCEFSADLLFQRTSESTQLSSAGSSYGLKSLDIVIFTIGPKWKSVEKRVEKLQQIKNVWEHEIYTF